MLSKFELNLGNVLLDDLKISNDLYPSIKFFRQSIHSVQIWLMCLKSYHDENYFLNLDLAFAMKCFLLPVIIGLLYLVIFFAFLGRSENFLV